MSELQPPRLQRLLFPPQSRTFPGKRWVDIALRCLHLVGLAGLGGGFLLASEESRWLPLWNLTLGSGTLLSLLNLWSSVNGLFQLKGLAIIFELLLRALRLGCRTGAVRSSL